MLPIEYIIFVVQDIIPNIQRSIQLCLEACLQAKKDQLRTSDPNDWSYDLKLLANELECFINRQRLYVKLIVFDYQEILIYLDTDKIPNHTKTIIQCMKDVKKIVNDASEKLRELKINIMGRYNNITSNSYFGWLFGNSHSLSNEFKTKLEQLMQYKGWDGSLEIQYWNELINYDVMNDELLDQKKLEQLRSILQSNVNLLKDS